MKKLAKNSMMVISLLIAAMLFGGCSGNASQKSDIGLINDGVLKVGMEIGYPPFEMYEGVTPVGLDVDLANELAALLGVSLQLEDTAWDGIFSGLDINKYDAVISAVTISGERMQSMDFSTPYIENWQSIAVKKGTDPITSIEGLNGLTVGYQDATTSAELLDQLIQTGVVSCTLAPFDKVLNAFDDLRYGRVDAVLADSTVAEGYITREPDMFEITWHQSNDPGAEAERFGIAVKKGNEALLNAINEALKTLEENGKLDEIRSNWLS